LTDKQFKKRRDMRKTIFILAILAITISTYGQRNVVTVDSISSKASYCEIVGTQGYSQKNSQSM